MSRKFVKKPLEVEAFLYGFDKEPEWFSNSPCVNYIDGYSSDGIKIENIEPMVKIKTLEGIIKAEPGDYIIKGIKGEIYPCKADVFEASYDEIKG